MINFKDFENIYNIEALINAIKVPEIPHSTNFWLIRAESGIFYKEYVDNDFVALAWNDILPEDINKANKDKTSKEKLYEKISEKYESKQPGTIFGKCDRFINEIKENDIFMIPDKSNNEITLAFAGKYYEESNLNTTEAEFIELKKSGWLDTLTGKDCPYIKRREIKVLKRIPGKNLNPRLFKALVSPHGLNNIGEEYADDILSSIYPIYTYDNKLNVVYRVQSEDKIDALEYSSFIYNSTKQINPTGELGRISVKSNINSPGDIVLNILVQSKETIKAALPYIAVTWIFLGGGKALGMEVNPIIKSISDALNDNVNRKKIKAETKSIEIQNGSDEIDLKMKQKFFNSIKDIDPNLLREISKSATPLDLNISDITRVIDLKEYKKNRDDS